MESKSRSVKVPLIGEDNAVTNGVPAELESDNVDRIVLRRLECRKLDRWLVELNKNFDGMIRVTKSDLANFVIRQHADSLSQHEVDLIESEFYDEVRWLNWALTKIRQAKREGIVLSLDELMAKRKARDGSKRNPKKHSRKDHQVHANENCQSSKQNLI